MATPPKIGPASPGTKAPKNKRVRKVLLAATLGIATLTIEGCLSCGNLIAPPPSDAGRDAAIADAGTDAGQDAAASTPDAAAVDAR
jgi:hypothetical protein